MKLPMKLSPPISVMAERLVGKNAAYYSNRWSRIKYGWNWAALLWWPLWLGYRKMYKNLIFSVAIVGCASMFLEIIGHSELVSGIDIGISVGLGMNGNHLYREHIRALEQKHMSNRVISIEGIGGVSWKGVAGGFLVSAAGTVIFGALAAFIPNM